jgi:hypothetical protein
MSTEEDAVDEAGRTTQPPRIMAPLSLKADPDGEAADVIVDNGITSSSAVTGDEDSAEAGSSTTVPLPAETIGKAWGRSTGSSGSTGDNGRSSERQGSRQAMTAGDSTWLADREEETADSAVSATSAASVTTAEEGAPAVKSDGGSFFTPSMATSSTSTAAPPSTAAPAAPESSYSGSSYSGQGSSYSGTAYASPPSHTRTEWSTGPDGPATAPSASPFPSSAPAGGFGVAPPSGNGYSPSNAPSSGAASAAGGAAAGLAGSVTPPWQKRGSASGIQTRKSTKRQAMLTLARVEPWSVMKFSFVASVVAFIILFVAVAVLYMVLSALGVFDSLQSTVSSVTSSQSAAGTNISHWFSASLILGYTAMLGALNIVLITAMSTVGSVVYNLIAKTIGGIEVTLRETD